MTRFVFFDLGNVLVRFSISRLLEQLSKLLRIDQDDIRNSYFGDQGIQQRFEAGAIDPDDYYEQIVTNWEPVLIENRCFTPSMTSFGPMKRFFLWCRLWLRPTFHVVYFPMSGRNIGIIADAIFPRSQKWFRPITC